MKHQVIIKTPDELQNKIRTVVKQLQVKKSDLSKQTSRKISAADPRTSAKVVGSVLGTGIITLVVLFIVVLDLPVFYRHIRHGPYA